MVGEREWCRDEAQRQIARGYESGVIQLGVGNPCEHQNCVMSREVTRTVTDLDTVRTEVTMRLPFIWLDLGGFGLDSDGAQLAQSITHFSNNRFI